MGGAQYLAAVADSLNGKPGDYAAFKAANAGRKPQVYVGANDGMLHAFDAKTGQETFAFIPTPVIPNLYRLADSNYNTDSSLHRYYVDGTPVVADVYIGNAWRTVLIGTLRGGGRGVFALDVTSPDNVSLLWEYTSQDDADLGYTFATPVVSRLHNGKWAVLLGNGYNSSNGNASLIVLDVASGSRIAKLTTSASGNNGLSSVRAADVNGDGVADYAYAGDLQGNLWRFDLFKTGSAAALEAASISSASEFAVAFGNQPLYRASTPGQNPVAQAITAPPSLVRHPSRTGYIVIFGTGRYFTAADKQTDTLQTLYGVWDRRTAGESTVSAAAVTRKDLVAQTISQVDNATFGAVTRSVRTVTQNPVDWSNVDGWVLDLKVGTELLGERITDEMYARGNVLFVTTRTPSPDPCQAGLTGWTYGIDPYTGGRTAFNVFDLSRDGVVGTDDQYNDSVISGLGTSAGGIALGNDKLADSSGDLTTVSFGPNVTGRQSWRVIPEVFQK
ncbi:Neisseria PilC protein [compost metagenome]